MSEYPKREAGRCELHNAVLYADTDGYRCWPCEDQRIRARQEQRAERARPGPHVFELETAFELAMEYAQDPERWRDPAKGAAWLLSVEARKLQDRLDQALVDVRRDVYAELERERIRHRVTETQLAEAQARIGEMENLLRRDDADQVLHAVEDSEIVCALLGYDPGGGQPVGDWVEEALRMSGPPRKSELPR